MAVATHADPRHAAGLREIPARGWLAVAKRVKRQVRKDRLSVIAAGVAFYGLLAVFPGLVALVGLYGLVADPAQVERHVEAFGMILPDEASGILLGQLQDLAQTNRTALGFGALAGLVLALWSASAAVRALMKALNVAYGEEEDRGFLRFYGTALLLTLGAIVAMITAIALVIALPPVLGFLGLGSAAEAAVSLARWPLLALFAVFGFAVAYRYGPSRPSPRWRWVSPGAVTGVLLWIAGSALFSLYVSRFGTYNETYGAAGAVVILLIWFLLSSYSILIGAEINAEAERQAGRDTPD